MEKDARMFDIVKKAIDEFNPYGLLPEAPSNEFDSESRKIAEQISINSTVEQIAEIIGKVLSRAFDIKFEVNECMTTAENINMSINGYIRKMILNALEDEEQTIYHIDYYMKLNNVECDRDVLKAHLNQLLFENTVKFYDVPLDKSITFENSPEEFIEDFWFILTQK